MFYKYVLPIVFILLSLTLNSQDQALDQLLQQGITAHRSGDYDKAQSYYNRALEQYPQSYDAHYELAMTLMQIQKFEDAILHCEKILENDNDLHIHAYIAKASALDYLTETEQAIDVLHLAIKEEGNNYLVHYNLAYYYFSLLNHNKARIHAMEAIKDNNAHASSHLLLASIESDDENRVRSLFPFYYYLLLEPTSVRSENAFESLISQLNIRNQFDKIDEYDAYAPIEKYLSFRDSSEIIRQGEQFDKDGFIELTSAIFSMCGVLELDNDDIYSEMYQPFYNSLASSPHMYTYGNYICQIASKRSYTWSLDNREKLEAMNLWLQENYDNWKYK